MLGILCASFISIGNLADIEFPLGIYSEKEIFSKFVSVSQPISLSPTLRDRYAVVQLEGLAAGKALPTLLSALNLHAYRRDGSSTLYIEDDPVIAANEKSMRKALVEIVRESLSASSSYTASYPEESGDGRVAVPGEDELKGQFAFEAPNSTVPPSVIQIFKAPMIDQFRGVIPQSVGYLVNWVAVPPEVRRDLIWNPADEALYMGWKFHWTWPQVSVEPFYVKSGLQSFTLKKLPFTFQESFGSSLATAVVQSKKGASNPWLTARRKALGNVSAEAISWPTEPVDSLSQLAEGWAESTKSNLIMELDPQAENIAFLNHPANFSWLMLRDTDWSARMVNGAVVVESLRRFVDRDLPTPLSGLVGLSRRNIESKAGFSLSEVAQYGADAVVASNPFWIDVVAPGTYRGFDASALNSAYQASLILRLMPKGAEKYLIDGGEAVTFQAARNDGVLERLRASMVADHPDMYDPARWAEWRRGAEIEAQRVGNQISLKFGPGVSFEPTLSYGISVTVRAD
ncbi:hypothetical protein BH11ARM1_BH11ARM1_14360 [soil metagenome]